MSNRFEPRDLKLDCILNIWRQTKLYETDVRYIS